jgi:hypothetical protein
MRYRMVFLAGLAVGYVLGARAGRERYETIARTASGLATSPPVQGAFGAIQEQASDLVGSARRRATDKFGDRIPSRFLPSEKTTPSYGQTSTDGQAGG